MPNLSAFNDTIVVDERLHANLAEKIPGLHYPFNFVVLYLVALPCMVLRGALSGRYRPIAVPDEKTPPFLTYFRRSTAAFVQDRRLLVAWIAYLLWYFTLGSMTNLSLYTREALGRIPLELAGSIMALLFGLNELAGFGIGALFQLELRRGAKAAMVATVVLVGCAIVWLFCIWLRVPARFWFDRRRRVGRRLFRQLRGLHFDTDLDHAYFSVHASAFLEPNSSCGNGALG